MAQMAAAAFVAGARANLVPPASGTLDRPDVHLLRADEPHADWSGGLDEHAVADILARLPVLDLFRLGYLFSHAWLQIWRTHIPLQIHDKQFARLPIPASDVPDAIANVLELYVGEEVEIAGVDDEGSVHGGGEGQISDVELGDGVVEDDDMAYAYVHSFVVESTQWRAHHAARWFAALRRGLVRGIVLANSGLPGQQPMLARLPPGLRLCTSVLWLYLSDFTVEAVDIDHLARLETLALYRCACRPGVIESAVDGGKKPSAVAIYEGALNDVSLKSTRVDWFLLSVTAVDSVTVDDAERLSILYPGRPFKLSIRRAPKLSEISTLDLSTTVLEIEGIKIEAGMSRLHPTMPSVTSLALEVDYTEMRRNVPAQIERVIKCFPRLDTLIISRKDGVSPQEGPLLDLDEHVYQNADFFGGVECVASHLRYITLDCYRGGRAEIALLKALLDKVQVLEELRVNYIRRSYHQDVILFFEELHHDIIVRLHVVLDVFAITSPNQALQNKEFARRFQPV